MKRIISCLYGLLSIGAASATVYDGTYTNDITITQDSLIEANSVFNDSVVYIKKDQNLTVKDNVQFIGGQISTTGYYDYGFYLNLDGNNIVFKDSQLAIQGGVRNWQNTSSSDVHDVEININGNDIVFDGNGGYSYLDGGGAIYIGLPKSVYYHSSNHFYKQYLTINGSGTVFSNNTSTRAGGAIFGNDARMTFNSPVEFNNNSANWGGAIYNSCYHSGFGWLKIAPYSQFINNSAGTGGAIYNENSYAFIGAETIFRGNSATHGGAIYNTGAKASLDIDTGNTFVNFETATDSIHNSGGTINFLGTGAINAGLTSLTSVRGDNGTPVINIGKASATFNTVTLQDNTTLKTTVWRDGGTVRVGNISANNFDIQNNDELKLVITVENRDTLSIDGSAVSIFIDSSGAQVDGWDFFGNPGKHPVVSTQNNLMYDIEFISDGVYKITPKAYINPDPSDTSDIVANVASAWNMIGFTKGGVAEDIANRLHVLAQLEETVPEYRRAIETLIPDPNGTINNIITRRADSNVRFLAQRLNSGKLGFWANGGFSSINNGDSGSATTYGAQFGQDIQLGKSLIIGQAFGYSQTGANDEFRDFDLDNNFNMALYAQFAYPIETWDLYINTILDHGAYNVGTKRQVLSHNINSELDAEHTSWQATVGLKRGLIGFDVGFRNTNVKLGGNMDAIGQQTRALEFDNNYAVATFNLADTNGDFQWGAYIGSDFVIGGTEYETGIATAPNGQRFAFNVKTASESALTFGANMDFNLSDAISLGVSYAGLVAGDYTEYIGKIRFNWAW